MRTIIFFLLKLTLNYFEVKLFTDITNVMIKLKNIICCDNDKSDNESEDILERLFLFLLSTSVTCFQKKGGINLLVTKNSIKLL